VNTLIQTDAPALASAPPATAVRSRRRRGAPPGEPRRVAYLYLAPAMLLVTLFVLLPLLHTLYLSFFRWDGITAGTLVGLDNYVQILTDPAMRSLFVHSAVLVFFYAGLPIAFGLLITAIFSRRTVKGMTFYRSVLFAPQAMSLVVVAIAWQWVYAQTGIANQFLGFLGLNQGIAWLGDFTWALPAIGLIGSWLLTGLCMVLFLSGVQKIDNSLYEAARLDGANAWHEFRYVTMPGLRAEMAVALTLTVVAALRSFDLVFLMTKGGPGTATAVPGYEIFARAFSRGQVGSASSLAVVLAVVIVIVTVLINRFAKEPEE
jgi:raffinose/stachyose/melibiose transport system permease protein